MLNLRIVKFVERNLLTIELIFLLIAIIISSFIQVIAYFYNLSAAIGIDWITNTYSWIISKKSGELLTVIDGFALIVGGLSFFLEKWIDNDTENIVYILVVVVSLVAAHVCKLLEWNLISVSITFSVGLLMLIPFSFLIFYSLRKSERRNKRRNTPRW